LIPLTFLFGTPAQYDLKEALPAMDSPKAV
jgi:hypothetical protein